MLRLNNKENTEKLFAINYEKLISWMPKYISKIYFQIYLRDVPIYMLPNVRVTLMLSFSLGDQKASFLLV